MFVPEDEKINHGIVCEHDGEFFMSMKDFFANFDAMEMCHISPQSWGDLEEFGWHENHFEGSWIAGESAGGCRNYKETFAMNPQFVITLEDSDDDDDEHCTCVISLMQKGSRKNKAMGGNGCLSIGNFYVIFVTASYYCCPKSLLLRSLEDCPQLGGLFICRIFLNI